MRPSTYKGAVIISPYCDFRCLFCSGKSRVTEEELREQEIKIYKNLQEFKSQGIKNIEISGSDPIEYQNIADLVAYMKDQGFENIQISTHGARLANPDFADQIIDSGLSHLRIPIYGTKANIHDSVTGKKGSFEATVAGLKYIIKKAPNIHIQISTLAVKNNQDNLIDVFDFVYRLGIRDHYFAIPFIADGNYSFYIPLKDLPPVIRPLYHHSLKINDETLFLEIPFCVFGEIDRKHINNTCAPPNLGAHCQPPEKYKTGIPNLPSYRKKRKADICKDCLAAKYCDGFPVNDVDRFGTGELQPFK
jgi:MoaA/NifB/PqqE/SkfB family radical SAM enzyme